MREGMARVVPVPLLSLFTGYELETMVSKKNLASSWRRLRPQAEPPVLTDSLSSGVREPGHPPSSAQVRGHLQGGGADIGAHPVVLGGDGVLLQHGAVALPEVRLGSHSAAPHHR